MVELGFWEGTVALVTVGWLAGWTWWSLKKIVDGWEGSALFAILVHVLFCGSPLLLDLLIGTPTYKGLPGVARASSDLGAEIVYSLYVSLVPMILCWVAPVKKITPVVAWRDRNPVPLAAKENRVLRAVMMAPILLVLLAPLPEIYLEYTPYQRGLNFRPEAAFFHIFVRLATILSVLAVGVLLLRSPRFWVTFAQISPFLVIAIWLNGKRNLAAIAVVFLGYVVWRRGLLQGKALLRAGALVSLVFIGFSIFYQVRVRFSEETVVVRPFEDWYHEFRIDYGRDDVLKLVIFREMYPHFGQILDYRGQSLEIYATALLPRDLWPDKPSSYPYRVSAAAGESQLQARGGALTTSILGEAIANASWWGVILGPLMLGGLCRVADRAPRRSFFQCAAFFFALFVQATHLLGVYVIFLGWASFGVARFLTSPRRPTRAVR